MDAFLRNPSTLEFTLRTINGHHNSIPHPSLKSWEDSKRRRQYFKLLKNLNDFKAFEFLYIRHLRITNSSLEKKMLFGSVVTVWVCLPQDSYFEFLGWIGVKFGWVSRQNLFTYQNAPFAWQFTISSFILFFLSLVKFRNSFIIKILRFLFLLKDFSALSNQRFKS